MIGSGLKKLAAQYGLKTGAGVAYGSLMGYSVTMSDGNGYKSLVISTVFPDGEQRSALQTRLDQQELSRAYRVQALDFAPKFIRIVFLDNGGTLKRMEAFISWFFPLLGQYGATVTGICPQCGQPAAVGGSWKLVNGTAVYLHDNCAQQIRQSLRAEAAQRRAEDTGSYFWGALGALLGALVGAVLWAIVLSIGYVASIVGFVIGWLANLGYNLLHGKQGKAKVAILILAVIFGVLAGYFGAMAFSLSHGSGLPLSVVPYVIIQALGDPSVLPLVARDVLIGLVFAALGVFTLIHRTGKELTEGKVIDLA